MANWQRLGEFELTDAEESAILFVYDLLIDDEIADWSWSPIRHVTTVNDADALEHLTGLPLTELTQRAAAFELNGTTMLSPEGTLPIAEFACRRNPMPVLDFRELVLDPHKDYQPTGRPPGPSPPRNSRTPK